MCIRIKLNNRRIYLQEYKTKLPDTYLVTFERLLRPDEREGVENFKSTKDRCLTHNGKVLVNEIILTKAAINAMFEGVKYLEYEKIKNDL